MQWIFYVISSFFAKIIYKLIKKYWLIFIEYKNCLNKYLIAKQKSYIEKNVKK